MNPAAQKPSVLRNYRALQYLSSFCLLLFVLTLGYIRATKGIDLTDEGWYLSTPLRYSLGDVPFRDEFTNTVRLFDLLVSPVFTLFPDISLLQMRLLGTALHVLSLLSLFLLLRRFAPPLILALACSVAFFINCGIMSPSYNLLSRAFSLSSLAFFMLSVVCHGKPKRMGFSMGGGVLFALSVFSYASHLLLILMPLGTCIFSLVSPSGRRHRLFTPSLLFLGAFLLSMILAFALLAAYGLLPDLAAGFAAMQTIKSTRLTLLGRALGLLRPLMEILPYGMGILGIYLLSFFIVPAGKNPAGLILGLIGVVLTFSAPLLFSMPVYFELLSFLFILAGVGLFLNYRAPADSDPERAWDTVAFCSILWGYGMALVYGISSDNALYQSRFSIAPLLTVSMAAVYRYVVHYTRRHPEHSNRKRVWPVLVYVILMPFVFLGGHYFYHNIYRDLAADRLTCPFEHRKLKGIRSTPRKVAVLENLLYDLGKRMEPGDYLLAYDYIPMLYYLTHTRPAYGAAWARADWPLSLRKRLVRNMVERDRVPEFCVRMLTWPMNNWNRIVHYREPHPLDAFVRQNYYLERVIYPFEVWHRGAGPKLRIFEARSPAFRAAFPIWPTPMPIRTRQFNEKAAPLVIQNARGDFTFSSIREKGRTGIRISPPKEAPGGKIWIQFGYAVGRNGFQLNLEEGRQITITVSARRSGGQKKPAVLFIRDREGKWQMNAVLIDRNPWEDYIVSKRIRRDAAAVELGILWEPERDDAWMEIRDLRVYVDRWESEGRQRKREGCS